MKFWIIEILNSLCNDLYFVSNFFLSIVNLSWTLKRLGVGGGGEEGQFDPSCGFSKIVFCRNRMKPCFSCDFFLIFHSLFPVTFLLKVSLKFLLSFRRYEDFTLQYYLFLLIFWIFLTLRCYKYIIDRI